MPTVSRTRPVSGRYNGKDRYVKLFGKLADADMALFELRRGSELHGRLVDVMER